MKNKKGSKNQKYVQQVTQQVKTVQGKTAKDLLKQEEEKAKKKELAGTTSFVVGCPGRPAVRLFVRNAITKS